MQTTFSYRPSPWTFLGVTIGLLGVGSIMLAGGSDALNPKLFRFLGAALIGIWILGAPFNLYPLLLGPGKIEIGPEQISFPITLRRKAKTLDFNGPIELRVTTNRKDRIVLEAEGGEKVVFRQNWFASKPRFEEFREMLLERLNLDRF